MRLKLYRAAGVTEAMARVRAELGADALILGTRRVADGVELTAVLEPDDEPPVPLPDPERERMLAWHGVPARLADKLAVGKLESTLGRVLRFGEFDFTGDSPQPLLLAGPPGAGKTLTVARLATRLVMAGVQPLIITTDGRRAGATEQLAAFTRLLGLTLIVASHPATLSRALTRRQPGAPVLIDAPGTDPFDQAQNDEVAGLACTANAATALVLPAGLDAAESADLASAFASAGATMLVGTRLDMARRLGGLLAAADAGKLTMTEAGTGPGAADGLEALTAAMLANRLSHTGATRSRALSAELQA
ncbi:GTP-binding protein [Acidisphaera sp. L21]|uniref:flagellar biosynthesis protein FlhF n=1 Tax=Acidisphaera sp. L21 TaxID=1641851 RepID=UPI00131DDB74|nr:GTP-binding protein [Acidisphaera sp. L21]